MATKKVKFSPLSLQLEEIITNVNTSLYEPRLFTFKLDSIPPDEFYKVHDSAVAYDIIKSTQIIPLPRSITLQQMKATMRRFNITKVTDEVIARAGTVYYCYNCDSFKNIIVTANDLTKQKATKSSGYTKLAYDIETDASICCDSAHCEDYALQAYTILDRRSSGILAIRDKPPVMVSPCCGFVCTLDSTSISEGKWTCPHCAVSQETHFASQEPDLKACHFCKKLLRGKHADNIVRLLDDQGVDHMYGFCKSHFRPWARCKNGTLTMAFYIDNIKNRKGQGLALP